MSDDLTKENKLMVATYVYAKTTAFDNIADEQFRVTWSQCKSTLNFAYYAIIVITADQVRAPITQSIHKLCIMIIYA